MSILKETTLSSSVWGLIYRWLAMKEGLRAVFIGKVRETLTNAAIFICCNAKRFVIGSSRLVALDTNICLRMKEKSTLALPKSIKNYCPWNSKCNEKLPRIFKEMSKFPNTHSRKGRNCSCRKSHFVFSCYHQLFKILYDLAFYFELR